jgi:MarR family transcriptional regulator for hemolysin
MTVLARLMRNNFDKLVASLGVTRSQWAMIAVISRRPGLTQRAIAESLEISEASAGRLVDRLCAEGLLERREKDDDRRARAVYLTSAAEPIQAKLTDLARQYEELMFKGFDTNELDTLIDYLTRIHDNISRG